MNFAACPLRPYDSSFCMSMSCFTVSNALAKSRKTEKTFKTLSMFSLISSVTESRALIVDNFFRKLLCFLQSVKGSDQKNAKMGEKNIFSKFSE